MARVGSVRDLVAEPFVARRRDNAAVAATAIFAGGALLSQTVIVPGWRAMDPAAFLTHFPTYGPATGGTVFPFEIVSLLLLSRAGYRAVIDHQPGRLALASAAGCMAGTFVLLIYFLPANLALLDPTFPPHAVPSALTTWYRWNWVRAGLGLAATVLACIGLTTRSSKEQAR